MAELLAYLEETKSEPFVFGKSDCTLWVANFIARFTGVDPAASCRGAYNSRYSCKRYLAFNGGLIRLVSKFMSEFPEGDDVVIVEFEGKHVAGFKVGSGVAVKAEVGHLILNQPNVVKGWRIWSK